MNRHLTLVALLWAATTTVCAQVAQYSYISDRRFTSPDQLMGYDFKPAMREVPGEEPDEVQVGSYSFGITRKNLYVEGADIRGVYSLNEINTTEYGFILRTMNARDPTIQGHLKIVVDERGQVEGLIFKRSNKDKEVIYFLRMIPEDIAAAEAEYFTNKGQENVEHLDSLWTGVEIRPFLRIFNNMGGVQQRVLPSDSLSLRFYHVTTVEEKDNKVLALVKGKKKRRRRRDRDAETLTASAEALPLAGVGLSATAATPAPAVPRTSEGQLVDATVKLADATAAPAVTAATAVTAAPAAPFVLDSVLAEAAPFDSTALAFLADTLALTPDTLLGLLDYALLDTSLHAAAELARLPPVLPTALDTATVDSSDLKITTRFYVDLNSFMRYDDGAAEMQHRTYLVNGAAERINPNARPGGDKYQWELNLHKQPNAYVYLDEQYNVNSIEIDGQKFYMRGQ